MNSLTMNSAESSARCAEQRRRAEGDCRSAKSIASTDESEPKVSRECNRIACSWWRYMSQRDGTASESNQRFIVFTQRALAPSNSNSARKAAAGGG